MNPCGAVVFTLRCHATGPWFEPGVGQNCHSTLKRVDKKSTKFAWEQNTEGPVSGDLTRANARAPQGPWSGKQNSGHCQPRSITDCSAEFN